MENMPESVPPPLPDFSPISDSKMGPWGVVVFLILAVAIGLAIVWEFTDSRPLFGDNQTQAATSTF